MKLHPVFYETGIQRKERILIAKRKHIIYKEEFRHQAVEMVIHMQPDDLN